MVFQEQRLLLYQLIELPRSIAHMEQRDHKEEWQKMAYRDKRNHI